MWSVKLSPTKNVVCDCPLNSLHVRGIVQRISRSCRYYGIIYWFWKYTKNKPQKFPQELFMRLTCANGSTKKIYNTLIQRLRLIFKQRVIFKQMREALVNNEITIVVSTVHLLVIILFLDCSSYFIKFIDFCVILSIWLYLFLLHRPLLISPLVIGEFQLVTNETIINFKAYHTKTDCNCLLISTWFLKLFGFFTES